MFRFLFTVKFEWKNVHSCLSDKKLFSWDSIKIDLKEGNNNNILHFVRQMNARDVATRILQYFHNSLVSKRSAGKTQLWVGKDLIHPVASF